MTEAKIMWEEPRDSRLTASVDFMSMAEEMRKNPGQWARVATLGPEASRTQASSLALGIRRGKYVAFKPQGQWQARSSKDVVWVRYIGENGEYADTPDKNEKADA